MSCFSTVSTVTANSELDLTKHVNYTSGMILGVDDFTQEFAYLAGRDRWLARDALGYGTLSGLSIRIEEDAEKGHRVMIQPGVAVSPRGQFICVPAAQCAYLNQWLAAAKPEDLFKWVKTGETSPPVSPPDGADELTLYVVLCYRDCLDDNVPIPGEPCRNENELSAASRVKDDFSLELRFEAPKQLEEEAVRQYVEWLKQIKITDTDSSTPLEDFLQAIRDEWLSPTSPPISSPPTALQIHADDVCEYLRTAFRLWVTELRNILSERKTGCSVEMTGGGKLEDCVLLAELRIPLVSLSPGWKVSDTEEVEINEKNRPFLLHLRMLQEWMLCGNCACPTETHPPIVSPPILSPPIVSPPITSPPEPTIHDHNLDSLSDVNVPTPADGQVLIFREYEGCREWVAEDPEPTPGVKPFIILPLAKITHINNNFYEIWFNIDAPGNLAQIDKGFVKIEDLKARMSVSGETDTGTSFLKNVGIKDITGGPRNVFFVTLEEEIQYLRFKFNLSKINVVVTKTTGSPPRPVTTTMILSEYAERNEIKFAGYEKERGFATIFVRTREQQ